VFDLKTGLPQELTISGETMKFDFSTFQLTHPDDLLDMEEAIIARRLSSVRRSILESRREKSDTYFLELECCYLQRELDHRQTRRQVCEKMQNL